MSFFDRLNAWARTSVTLKLLLIGVLILFLMIPAFLIDDLIRERANLRDSAQTEVASKWGLEQTVGGPVISVPYSYDVYVTVDDERRVTTRTGYAHFLPGEVDIDGQMTPRERYRGIYVVVLYNSKLRVTGSFDQFNAAALSIPENALRWADALFTVGIADMTGVNDAISVQLGDSTLEMGPGTITQEFFDSGVSAPIDLSGRERDLAFSFDLDLNGSSALYFRPFGKRTNVSLAGGWANPSFDGTFLPREREVTDAGYAANWEVLQLNRNYPQQGTGTFAPKTSSGYRYNPMIEDAYTGYEDNTDRFGVRLLLPVDEYKKTYRSTNFAMLFIIITFLTFFFIEVLNQRRVHPIQYLLIGAAIILFYVLLLSISEHRPFNFAYWVSAVATAGLISGYSYFILRNPKLTALVAAILLVLYVFFFSLLQLQDFALLIGSLGLFVILATIMYLTRNIDWYNLGKE